MMGKDVRGVGHRRKGAKRCPGWLADQGQDAPVHAWTSVHMGSQMGNVGKKNT